MSDRERSAWDEAEEGEQVSAMNVKDCADRVDAIIAMGNADPEARHSEEDMLMRDVFHSIITDGSNARDLAWEVIRLFGDEDTIRWYA